LHYYGAIQLSDAQAAAAIVSLYERPAERLADMRRLALGETFQGLIAWDSFFHLTHDDQRRMFGVFQTHAAPGAALLFTSGPRHGVSVGSYHGEALYHASLDPVEYETLLQGHGSGVLAYVPEDPTCGAHTVWLAKRSDAPP